MSTGVQHTKAALIFSTAGTAEAPRTPTKSLSAALARITIEAPAPRQHCSSTVARAGITGSYPGR